MYCKCPPAFGASELEKLDAWTLEYLGVSFLRCFYEGNLRAIKQQ